MFVTATTHAAKEALWLHSLIQQLFNTCLTATNLFSDNQSAIELTKDHQYYACTKHINVFYHFIHWVIKQGSIKLIYCPTEDIVSAIEYLRHCSITTVFVKYL